MNDKNRWWAVDRDGPLLDGLAQPRRDRVAAKTFFRTLLKGLAVGATLADRRQARELWGR